MPVATALLAPQARADGVSDFLSAWNPDHDQMLDLAEISKAADAQFDKLDADHDGSLSRKEVGTRYETIVARRFHAANWDKDATIEVAELKIAAGRRLLQLLQ